MSNGPIPSKLTFLSTLPSHKAGTKVRFLGCVTRSTAKTSTISLEHAYPLLASGKKNGAVVALVDIQLLLETLKRDDIQIGEWVNIIGYVQEDAKEEGRESAAEKGFVQIKVQAIILWSAGRINLREYEKGLMGRLKTDTESEG